MKDMVAVPGGTFLMGSEEFYEEERPVREVTVDPFSIDEHQVTVAEFRRFVKATGYVTVAERAARPGRVPRRRSRAPRAGLAGVPPDDRARCDLRDVRNWWSYVPGAQWRHPEGPGSTLHGRERHPVTQVAFADAAAYAAWAGKELPTEAEWEFAARGGLEQARFTWGDEFAPKGKMMANTWQGEFPWQNLLQDGFAGTSPVKSFPPNGYGLYDMAGNVWEWTADAFGANGASGGARVLRARRRAHDGRKRGAPRRRRRDPAQGHQGRVAPVRAELLPALPAGSSTDGEGRHLDRPPRVPLRRPRRRIGSSPIPCSEPSLR